VIGGLVGNASSKHRKKRGRSGRREIDDDSDLDMHEEVRRH
jgi:hypothetical protein